MEYKRNIDGTVTIGNPDREVIRHSDEKRAGKPSTNNQRHFNESYTKAVTQPTPSSNKAKE